MLRAGEPGTEPRVNHCLPPPTQVTLALHMDTRICNTAFCWMPTAISLLMPYGEGSLCNHKTLNLIEKKRSNPLGTAPSKEMLMNYLTGEYT